MGITSAVGYCQEEEDAFSAGAKAAQMALEKLTAGQMQSLFLVRLSMTRKKCLPESIQSSKMSL